MDKNEVLRLTDMRKQGVQASAIANALGISVNTVRSYIRRHPLPIETPKCECCGKAVRQLPGRKRKRFCSDTCRMLWWNSHRSDVKRKTSVEFCEYCGKEYTVYGSKNRRFCSRECYFGARRKVV